MTTLSREALDFPLDDYEVRLTPAPDAPNLEYPRLSYGVFNKHTGVREAMNDSLPFAFATAYTLQDTLKRAVTAAKAGVQLQVDDDIRCKPRVQ